MTAPHWPRNEWSWRSQLSGDRNLRLAALAAVLLVTCAAPERDKQMPSSTTAPSSPPTARLLFLGDTSFGENYQEQLAKAGGENVLESRGYGSMMVNFAAILDGAELVAANLETPVTDHRSSPLVGRKRYIHYANVEEAPRTLAKYGISLVSLATTTAWTWERPGWSRPWKHWPGTA
jgi:hypothetical protein